MPPASTAGGTWDFQTMDAINEAFADSGTWQERKAEIQRRLMVYIVTHPHPKMSQ